MSKTNTKNVRVVDTRPKEGVLVIAQPCTILDVIATAANDASIDPAKMSALLEMQIKIMAIEREKAFNESLAALQGVMPTITKHGKVDFTTAKGRTHYDFERYEDIDAALRPLTKEYGFSYVFFQTEEPNKYKGTLLHKDGHSMSGYFNAEPDNSGGKNQIQAGGSTWSYMRRYIFKGLLNIVTIGEDDDAQSFSYINAVQTGELESLLEKFEINKEAFLKQFGVESVSKIAATHYETVVRAINERNAKKALKITEVTV